MPAWKIDINVNQPGPPRASFSPSTLQAQVGDSISWANNDNQESHWPAPVVNGQVNKTGWLSEAIPPNASSKQSLSPSAPGPLKYCCAIAGHQNETGVIWVVSAYIYPNPSPTQNAPASFSPSTAQAKVGATVLWANNDSNQHQPMPSGGSPTAWFSAPIQPGQIGSSSKPTSATGAVNYGCALHLGEKGVINVS